MDNPKHTAFNLNAPQDERTDALTGLQKSHLPTNADLLPKAAIDEMTAWVNDELALLKAIDPDNVPQPSYAAAHGKDGMQSVLVDDYQASFRGDFWERPGLLPFDQLRSMTAQMPVLNAVVMTRTRQVQRFCRVSEKDNTLPGFEIRHRDRKHQITGAEQKKIQDVAMFMSNCGSEALARQRKALRRDSFAQFMGKITRDSLILDSVGIETEWRNDRKLGLNGLYAVDGATIRLCSEEGYRGDPDIYAVQVVNGRIRTAYTFEDLIYEPRNPRADVSCAGYGLPETELLIRLVTGFLNAMSLNNNVFDKNSIPKGVLHLFGNYSNEDLVAFRRYWQNMSKGVNNAFAMPILASKDQASAVKFEKFGVDFSEMMFAKWMTFLTSLICAIYGMSPSEINFDSFTGGTTSALGGNDTAEKLAASKDSGLRPLLAYFENLLTDYVVSELDNDFCFRWTGLDVEDQDKKYELRKTLLTLNELRAEEGYEKIDGALGDAPVDASLLNAWMQLKAQQPEGEGAQDSGDDDKEPLQKANGHHDGHGQFAASDSAPVRLAPNGKPSNLNSEQYAQVRTPEFKKWFGDWEKQIQKNFLLGESIIALSGDEFQKEDIPLTKRVTKWFEENYSGKVNNPVIGNVLLNERGVKDSISHGLSKTKSAAFAAVPEIIKNGMVISSEENWKNRGYDGYTLAAPISIKGDAFIGVVIVHRDKQTQRFYLQEVVLREKLQPGTSFKTEALTGNKAALNGDSHTGAISSLLHEIFNVKESNAVDENGEPLPINGYFSKALPNEQPLHKAHNHDTPHDIFKPHENPFIRPLVEDYYESGMIRISAVRIALNQWLAGQRYQIKNAGIMPPSILLQYASGWSVDDVTAAENYLSGIDPELFTVNDLSLLAKLLMSQNLPEDVMIDEAVNHAAQSYIMGAAQSAWEANNPDGTITDVQVSALRAALPTALEGVVTAMNLSGMARATLDYGAARAAENIVALTDDARAKIQNVLMDNAMKRLSGDASATAKKLEQILGEKFGDMNRDWRRIALTETGEMSLQGFVAEQPIGAKLKRLEQYDGACSFCRKIDGTIVTVVDPEAPDKDGKTQIWQGKTNIGRSSSPRKRTDEGLVDREEHELWWLAAGVIHPHCRGMWVSVRSGNVTIPGL